MKTRRSFFAIFLAVLACATANHQAFGQSTGLSSNQAFYFSAGVGADLNDGATMKQQAKAES